MSSSSEGLHVGPATQEVSGCGESRCCLAQERVGPYSGIDTCTALLPDWLTVASSVQMATVITAGWGLTSLGCESWVRRENYLPLLLPVTTPDPWSEWAWADSGLGSVLGLLSSDLASPGL